MSVISCDSYIRANFVRQGPHGKRALAFVAEVAIGEFTLFDVQVNE